MEQKQAILNEKGFATTAGVLSVYDYHPETGEYRGSQETYIALGTGIPANSTLTSPPIAKENFVYCWQNNAWEAVENHRGEKVYNVKTGAIFEIKELGEIPAGYTEVAPPALKAGETLGGFDTTKKEWVIIPPTALFKAKSNLKKYYQNWQQNTPIGNDAPADTVKKAKELSDWIKEVEAAENPQKSAFVMLTVETKTAPSNPDFDPNNPPLIPDDELDW